MSDQHHNAYVTLEVCPIIKESLLILNTQIPLPVFYTLIEDIRIWTCTYVVNVSFTKIVVNPNSSTNL